MPRSLLAGADGVVGSSHRLSEVEPTTPFLMFRPTGLTLRAPPPKKRDHLLDGAATPPLPRRGLRLSRRLSLPVSSGRLVANAQPRLGGVAAPPRKCSRSLLAQTGWYGMARSHLIDNRVALLIQSVRFANIYKVASHHGSTTPPFAKKRANGTPPNLGGEFLAHLAKCPNSSRGL